MKAVLYCRVSSKEQGDEGYSLDAQEKTGREYARRHSLRIERCWKVAESAWTKGRDQFDQMVELLKRRDDIPHVIFDCLDRMTRNDFDKMKVYDLIKQHGKTIHFARTGKKIDAESGSDEEFVTDIEVAVAKKWSNDISRKASMGMREKAEQGLCPGCAPLGYDNDGNGGLKTINPETGPIIRTAFELMASGQYSLRMLQRKLHGCGLRSRKGNRVQRSTLEQMIKNPFYYGVFRWKGKVYQGKHAALISKHLFDAANDALTGRNTSFRPREVLLPFRNLATCGLCGCRIVGERKKESHTYYHCSFSKGRHPGVPYMKGETFVKMFDPCVKRVTIDDDTLRWLQDVLQDSMQHQAESVERRAVLLRKEKTIVETRLSRLYDSLCDGILSPEAFARKEAEYGEQLVRIKAGLADCDLSLKGEYDQGLKILEHANRLYPAYLGFDEEKKAKLLRAIASNYVVSGLNVTATYRTPFNSLVDLLPCPEKLPRLDSNQRPAD